MISFSLFFENLNLPEWRNLPDDTRFPTGEQYLNDDEDAINQINKLGGNPEDTFTVYRGDFVNDERFIRVTFGIQNDIIWILNISTPKQFKTSTSEFRNVFRKLFTMFPNVEKIGGERISGKTIGKFYSVSRTNVY